jgi:hypothetical protein
MSLLRISPPRWWYPGFTEVGIGALARRQAPALTRKQGLENSRASVSKRPCSQASSSKIGSTPIFQEGRRADETVRCTLLLNEPVDHPPTFVLKPPRI